MSEIPTKESDGLEPFELRPAGHMLDFGFSLCFFLKVFGKSSTSFLIDRFVGQHHSPSDTCVVIVIRKADLFMNAQRPEIVLRKALSFLFLDSEKYLLENYLSIVGKNKL